MAKGNRQHEIRTDSQPETPGGLPAQGTGDTHETTDSGGIQRHQDHDMEGGARITYQAGLATRHRDREETAEHSSWKQPAPTKSQ